ncbi:hypothetical protein Tco_0991300 [Tanacetum coccineum]|uniref:Integrase, catalytic region, zinc finger, CCHC-type, peptidase aspartic, catalytic n=1 Tax=Tanacetum coccineum TaxID=301880 RepID=A0ABQ5EYV9_9ASTR
MMANLSEDIQCASSDTRPPMLDRTDFESWQQRIRLYCLGKDNGVNILKLIDEGPFKMGKFRETLAEGAEGALHLGPERDRVFADLTPEEKERFTKLINDMRKIKMTMPKMQLNSKFVNTMLPEWGRFVTAVKLNRGFKQFNYDQLYAYLKQHEAHDNENKMMLERYNQHASDPLALVSNVSPHQYPSQSSVIPQSAYVPLVNYQPQFADNTQLDSGFTPTDDLIENLTKTVALLAQFYKTHLPQTHNQLRTSSNTRNQATVQNGQVFIQNVQCRQNRGGQTNTFDDDVDEASVQDLKLNEYNVFQADQCDAFDSDVDEAPTTQTMFMANLSSIDPIYDEAGPSYDSDILSEVQDHDNYVDSVGEYHKVHKMQNNVQPNYVVESDVEYTSDSNIILYEQYVKDNAVQVVQKPLKEHFERIQTALIKEVKKMKEIFKQMEVEVEQNAVDKQCADIERKNLLIQNENLIVNWLSNEVFYSVMNDGITISRFSEMHDAYTIEQARCLELEADLSKLKHKIQKDDHSDMIKRFFNLEIDHLNL